MASKCLSGPAGPKIPETSPCSHATLANGTLTITGTEGDDRVTVQQYGSDQIKVLLGNGSDALQLTRAAVDQIFAEMGGGNDRVSLGNQSTLRCVSRQRCAYCQMAFAAPSVPIFARSRPHEQHLTQRFPLHMRLVGGELRAVQYGLRQPVRPCENGFIDGGFSEPGGCRIYAEHPERLRKWAVQGH